MTSQTERSERAIRERVAAAHAAYEKKLAEWADTELGTNKSILLEDEMDRLTAEIVSAVPALLAENERLARLLASTVLGIDGLSPLEALTRLYTLKREMLAARASSEREAT